MFRRYEPFFFKNIALLKISIEEWNKKKIIWLCHFKNDQDTTYILKNIMLEKFFKPKRMETNTMYMKNFFIDAIFLFVYQKKNFHF